VNEIGLRLRDPPLDERPHTQVSGPFLFRGGG
jgi:hypothetical protein